MGVKDLWTILTPICERKPIWELQDKTIAIDLSAWICDSSTVAEHCSQKNMYLRNLFFRTSYLLLLGVKPIFVLEGKAPVLKHDTIEKRQQAQGKSAGRNVKAGSRARLKGLQTQCAALLSAMGLKCIQGDGEAEAFCALLNQAGLVDGVVTQDSDVFLYGGVKVYRHFNTSSAGGGSVDTYEMSQIHTKLGLGRNKLIALSLLCGCDYNKGVNGVGKESALKFFQSVRDEEILERIQQWRQNTQLDNIDMKKNKTLNPELKCELQIRAKALQDEAFPCQEVLDEFLQVHQKELPQVRFQWNKPNISQFLKLADVKLAWDSTYALEKALPLFTRWHLTHNDSSLTPEAILNTKTTRGIKGYVVKWEEFEVTTEEPQALFEDKYPHVVQHFVESKTKGKKRATKKNKENENPTVTITASQLESSEELKTKPTTKSRSRKVKNATTDGTTDAVLHEVKEEKNDIEHNCDENSGVRRVDKIIDKEIDENKTDTTKKPERKKKEPTTRRKYVTSENAKKKTDRKLCENNLENVDIRRYFKTNSVETQPLANVSGELFDDSMNLLNTSMNSLAIRTEKVKNNRERNNKDKVKSDKDCGIKDIDMNSDVIQNTGRIRRNIQTSFNDNLDFSINKQPTNDCVSSDMAERRQIQQSKHEDLGTQNKKCQDDIDGNIHLNDVDDILDFSFETACRIVSQKNKELGLNQSINIRDDMDYGEDIQNRPKDINFDKIDDINENEAIFEISESDIEKIDITKNEACNESKISDFIRENKPQYLDMTDFIMSINDSELEMDTTKDYKVKIDNKCLGELKGTKNNSLGFLETAEACTKSKISKFGEKKSEYLDMSDVNMSINTSEVKLDELVIKTDKMNKSLDLKDNVSTQISKNATSQQTKIEMRRQQNCPKQTSQSKTDHVDLNHVSTTENVDLVTESISYMSFTEGTSSPCRVKNETHPYESPRKVTQKNYESPNEHSQKIVSNIEILSTENSNTSCHTSSDNLSQRKHNVDYTKFTPNNSSWNTSSPLMKYNPRPSPLIRVNPARVSNTTYKSKSRREGFSCESPLRVKYQSHTEAVNFESPLRAKTNRLGFVRDSPGLPRVSSTAREYSKSSPLGAGVSFDMDDFEFDEGIEDLSGIIENIIGQK
ncbi:hypothetical protein WDU94_001074 [Cyamophila willieti]